MKNAVRLVYKPLNDMPKPVLNIGEIIKERLNKSTWGVGAEIARELGKRQLGDVAGRKDIGCNELVVFAKHLDQNFFTHFLTEKDKREICKGGKEDPGEVEELRARVEKNEFEIKHLKQRLDDKQNIIRDKEKLIQLLETRIGALEDQQRKSA